jgi:AcrR family transcriptional regulator
MMATDATRTAILNAAEALFAERGFAATSIREITRAAGVNVASVHYHFESKEGVLRGVMDRIVAPINRRRHDLLAATLRAHEPAPVDQLLDAFIRPDVESLQLLQHRGPTVARFVGQIYRDQTPWIQQMAIEQFQPSADPIVEALAATLGRRPDEIRWHIDQTVALIVHMFATWPAEGVSDDAAEAAITRLVGFLTPPFLALHAARAHRR